MLSLFIAIAGSGEQGPMRQDTPNPPPRRVFQVGVWTVRKGNCVGWLEMLLPPKGAFKCCLLPAASLAAVTHTNYFSFLIPLQAVKINSFPGLDLHSASNTWGQFHLSAIAYVTVTRRKPVGPCPPRLQCRREMGLHSLLGGLG